MNNLVLAFALLASTQAHAAVCGTLAAVKDKVEVLRVQTASAGNENVRHAVMGKNFMTLECDDIVQTGPAGSAKLVLGDDKVSVAPDSRVEIAAHSGTEARPKVDLLNLTYGKMRGLIKTRKETGSSRKGAFRVRTFSAVVGVRGTDLFASYDPNAGLTEQAVIEGRVEVVQVGTNQKVIVEAGQQVSVDTAPPALEAAKARAAGESPETAGPAVPRGEARVAVRPLKVVPIRESMKKDMRIASAIARGDADFAAPPAIAVLGDPRRWTIEREDVPDRLKKIENEF